jgi:tRNA (guanine-N7-)-methyltransferase
MARGRHPTRIYVDPPDHQTIEKYLLCWYGGDIIREPHRFPGLTSVDLFDNHNPLEIDFGCGMGVLAYNRAQQDPGINMLGIDISQKPLFCAIREAKALGLNNVKFIRSNYTALMPLIKPATISTAYYLFPNPPRDYYHQRANMGRKKFLETIYNALIPGGRFIFATDSLEFYKCIVLILATELQYSYSNLDINNYGLSTWYRNIWESRGKDVMGLIVKKHVPDIESF